MVSIPCLSRPGSAALLREALFRTFLSGDTADGSHSPGKHRLVKEKVEPRAAAIDASGEYPRDIKDLFAENDLLGIPFPAEYGGLGGSFTTYVKVVEEVSKACASSALIIAVQELGALPIIIGGSSKSNASSSPAQWSVNGKLPSRVRLRPVRRTNRLLERRELLEQSVFAAYAAAATASPACTASVSDRPTPHIMSASSTAGSNFSCSLSSSRR
jgi:hypothetical protein